MKKCAILALLAVRTAFAGSPSDAVHTVEPEWGAELQSGYYVDIAIVDVRADLHGRPFSFESETPLPENVIDALSRWQFASASPVPYKVKLSVRRALTPESTRALHRFWRPARFKDALEAGRHAAPPPFPDLGRNLTGDDQEFDIAAQLAWYANHATSVPADAPRKRADLIAFLVENSPDSELLASSLTAVNRTGETLGDTPPHDYIRSLWLERAKHAADSDSKIVFNIANFLELSDPDVVETLLQSSSLNAASIWIGDVWARASLGVNAVDPLTGRASATSVPNTAFADHARSSLLSTNDRKVLASALWAITADGHALAKSGRLPAGYQQLCSDLLARWRTADPQSGVSCDTENAPRDDIAESFMSGTLQLPHLIHKVEPRYSEAARKEHISGGVKARMIVDVDGSPRRIEIFSGPFALIGPALDALAAWKFEPATVGGHPVPYPAIVETSFKIR